MQSRNNPQKSVLIVDEKGESRDRLESLLQEHGYLTLSADLSAAKDVADKHHLDLIVAEEQVVREKGTALREVINEKEIPWLVAADVPKSASSLYKASEQGAREFVVMPQGVERSELLDTVRKVIKDPSKITLLKSWKRYRRRRKAPEHMRSAEPCGIKAGLMMHLDGTSHR